MKLTPEQSAQLAHEIFDLVCDATETFREQHTGSDLAYLMGAILDGDSSQSFVDWRHEEYGGRPALLDLLEDHLRPNHPVWSFIER